MTESRDFVDELDHQSLEILRSMIGKSWQGFSAFENEGAPGKFSGWDSVGIQLDDVCIKVENSENNLPLYEDFGDDIGHLSLDVWETCSRAQGDEELKQCFAGQLIREIYVVRSQARAYRREVLTWNLSSDFGLVFGLENGFVAVTRGSYQGYFLEVLVVSSIAELNVKGAWSYWTADDGDIMDAETGERYEETYELIPVAGRIAT